jgi:hypothetical protein
MADSIRVGAHSCVVGPKARDALGLLDAHPGSHRRADPGWRSTLPSAEQNRFTVVGLPLFATEPAP